MAVKRFLPVVALGVWFVTLAGLIREDNIQIFLRPEFNWLIYTGMFICLVLVAGLLAGDVARIPVQKQAWIKGLILMMPVGFIIFAGENTLGEYALSKRMMVVPGSGQSSLTPVIPAKTPAGQKTPDSNGTLPEPVSLSDLIREFNRFDSKAIQVEGLFAETIAGHDELSAVFRYVITCCAADAMPVGVFISRPRNTNLKGNDWVRVSGKVSMQQMDGYDVIFMDQARIEAAEKPDKNAAYIFN